MTTSNRVTKVFFWIAFSAFLAMSIPHVAYVFRFYEPKNDGYSAAWWVVSYGVAISIDMLICWLSYTRAEIESATRFDGFVTWLFIFLLAVLSWFCNWLFAEIMIGVNIWQNTVPFIGWTVGNFTPVIVSAIPMFLIAYTYMSKRILNSKGQTVDDLDKEIERLTGIKGRQEQLRELRKGTGFIAGVTRIAKDTKKAVSEVFTDDVQEPIEQIEQEKEHDTEPIANPSALEDIQQIEQVEEEKPTTDKLPRIKKSNMGKPRSVSTKKTHGNAISLVRKVLESNPKASISEIAKQTGVSRGHVSTLRSQILNELQIAS